MYWIKLIKFLDKAKHTHIYIFCKNKIAEKWKLHESKIADLNHILGIYDSRIN